MAGACQLFTGGFETKPLRMALESAVPGDSDTIQKRYDAAMRALRAGQQPGADGSWVLLIGFWGDYGIWNDTAAWMD